MEMNNQEQPFGAANNQPVGNMNNMNTNNGMGMPPPNGYVQKSKIVAGILGILLGGLGIHNFYLGFTKKALIQLLVSLCTCGIGALPMEIWGLVEGIQYLTGSKNSDANGIMLKD